MIELVEGVEKVVILQSQEGSLFRHRLAVKQSRPEERFTLLPQLAAVLGEFSQPVVWARDKIVDTGFSHALLLLVGEMLVPVL